MRCNSHAKSGGEGTHRLDECDLDRGIIKSSEILVHGVSSDNDISVGEGARLHADRDDEVADEIGFSRIGVR